MNERIVELFKNEEFCVEFFDNIEKDEVLKSVLKNNGLDLTDEELKELVDVAKCQMAKADNSEMNEEDLDNVAGGLIGWIIAGTASGIFFGYQVYKARKGLNSFVCR